jgi:hypothetical protein
MTELLIIGLVYVLWKTKVLQGLLMVGCSLAFVTFLAVVVQQVWGGTGLAWFVLIFVVCGIYQSFKGPSSYSGGNNGYPANWPTISRATRRAQPWCSRCRSRSELHTHHINRNKADCRPSNLMVLCKDCHGREHGRNFA